MAKEDTAKIETDEGARGFGVILGSLEDGALHSELSETLRTLNEKLRAHAAHFGAAKGELLLKLVIGVDDGGTVTIDSEVKTKEPKTKRARSVMWLTKSGNLTGANPRQTRLPLHEVPAPKAETREAPAAAAGEAKSV